MKIYTRRGDKGQSGLLSGERVDKDDPRLKTFGALDELQSHLGMARALIRQESVRSILLGVQKDIFVASSELASTPKGLSRLENRIGKENIGKLEKWIDEFAELYGLPDRFVVPGRSADSAALHVARAVCRRCERLIVELNRREAGLYDELLAYYNRVGDLLFVLAWALEVKTVVTEVVRDLLPGVLKTGESQ
ncbi:MAG: cob(I)yrinic acid a,c-diamide adenosyltransferase [Deltaproteobacteria bacterium]|nr:MAG: cob(I)yrinic acid a,c-diamide adenosyltransferase [Deltaproteobacteria bacterium]